MWGDGLQTRSFTFIDDCVEGILRITKSDFKEPLNLGSSEMVSIQRLSQFFFIFCTFALVVMYFTIEWQQLRREKWQFSRKLSSWVSLGLLQQAQCGLDSLQPGQRDCIQPVCCRFLGFDSISLHF